MTEPTMSGQPEPEYVEDRTTDFPIAGQFPPPQAASPEATWPPATHPDAPPTQTSSEAATHPDAALTQTPPDAATHPDAAPTQAPSDATWPQTAPPAATPSGQFASPGLFPAGQYAPGHFPAGQYAPASTSGIPYPGSGIPYPRDPTTPSMPEQGTTGDYSAYPPYTAPAAYPPPVSGTGYWPAAPSTAAGIPPVPKKKRRYGLIISLVLVVLVVLCGGVGTAAYVVSTRQTGTGSDTPIDAASSFLTAIYLHQNATAAADFVCKQADDASALKKKVAEVTKATDSLDNPTYSWSTLQVGSQSTKEATVTTDLTIGTDDEKRATQHLQILTVNANGWWVCDVKASAK